MPASSSGAFLQHRRDRIELALRGSRRHEHVAGHADGDVERGDVPGDVRGDDRGVARDAARRLPAETSWQKAAVETLIDDFYGLQADLTERTMRLLVRLLRLSITQAVPAYDPAVLDSYISEIAEIADLIRDRRRMVTKER